MADEPSRATPQPRGGRVPEQARLRPVCTLSSGIQPALLLNVCTGFLGSLSTVTPVRMTAIGPSPTSIDRSVTSEFDPKQTSALAGSLLVEPLSCDNLCVVRIGKQGSVERRLAAILAADVVGYSRLMGVNEAATLSALNAHRKELVDAKIAEHRGRIVKLTGDGMLVEFPSVVNAVACAAEIQVKMRERNAEVPESRRIEFRVGVNVGDVIVEGGDIFGDGVNVAARLEGIATPGGVAVSGAVRDHIGNRLDLAFEDLGERDLKNIERPVRVYGIKLGARSLVETASGEAQTYAASGAKTVDRRAALHQYERRSRAGIFRRRHHRGHYHRPLEGFRPVGHRPKFRVHLQGQACRRSGGRPQVQCFQHSRGERAQGRAIGSASTRS